MCIYVYVYMHICICMCRQCMHYIDIHINIKFMATAITDSRILASLGAWRTMLLGGLRINFNCLVTSRF